MRVAAVPLRRVTWRTAAAVMLLVAVLAPAFPQPVAADHFQYLQTDQSKQDFTQQGRESFANVWWITNDAVWWWADPSAPGFAADVATVINAWQTAVPQLRWLEVSDEGSADYVFRLDTSCGGVPACHRVTRFEYFLTEDASDNRGGLIIVDPSFTFAPTAGLRAALAHETGHAYGLHERYIDSQSPLPNPACNQGETTVMDDIRFDPVFNHYVHCDSLEGPATADVNRVHAAFGYGDTSDLSQTANGPIGTWKWHDLAWAEYDQFLELQFWNGSQWVLVTTDTFYERIGVHRLNEDRELQKSFDRRDYGFGPGNYRMCVWPHFLPYDHLGDPAGLGWCWVDSPLG